MFSGCDGWLHTLSEKYLLHTNDESEDYVKENINKTKTHFSHLHYKTEKINCDNGGEFESNFRISCNNKSIILDYIIFYSSQLNGVAERDNLARMN